MMAVLMNQESYIKREIVLNCCILKINSITKIGQVTIATVNFIPPTIRACRYFKRQHTD